jgi:putative ABC transport system ATP-binding protein
MKNAPRLEARALTKRFDSGASQVLAVDGVDLTLAAGERVAVTGASGSGKSTLLSLLAALERPDSGEVLLEGTALGPLGESALARLRGRRIGIVFQSFRLLPQLSALENVRVPLELAGLPGADAEARDWLERVGLGARAAHLPAQLSGGEQQRVALARALAPRPAVLLADEPTGNLDSRNGALIESLLLKLSRDNGASLLIVTHDARLASKTDRVLPMKDGRIQAAPRRRKARA